MYINFLWRAANDYLNGEYGFVSIIFALCNEWTAYAMSWYVDNVTFGKCIFPYRY